MFAGGMTWADIARKMKIPYRTLYMHVPDLRRMVDEIRKEESAA